jgi:superfamily II DNA or RNA helicase
MQLQLSVDIDLKSPDLRPPDLRPYQYELIADLEPRLVQGRSTLCCMPTSGGKTETIGFFVIKQICLGKKILFVVDRRQLLEQTKKRFKQWGIEAGIIQGKNKTDLSKSFVIASIDTLVRREYDLGQFDYVVLDEAHHAIADKYNIIFESFKPGQIVGLTATPLATGIYPKGHPKQGMKKHLRHRFDDLIGTITPKDLLAMGYLCAVKVYQYKEKREKRENLRTNIETGDYELRDIQREYDCYSMWSHLAGEFFLHCHYPGTTDKSIDTLVPTIGFACNIKHASNLANHFRTEWGIPCEIMTGSTCNEDRDRMLEQLEKGIIKVIFTVNVVSEGFNAPWLRAALFAAPTKSLIKLIQTSGRILRVLADKPYCIIIDQADNVSSLGHHPLDSLNLFAIWAEEETVPTQKMLPGDDDDDEPEKIERQRRARREELMEFSDYAEDRETRKIKQLLRYKEQNNYKPAWVSIQFTKTVYRPSKLAFKTIAKALGYKTSWADYQHPLSQSYWDMLHKKENWDKTLTAKDRDFVLSMNEEKKRSFYSVRGVAVEEFQIDPNPYRDNYLPQLQLAYKTKGWDGVRAVYKQLAMLVHPDANNTMPVSKMQNLNSAYDSLSEKYNKF